MFRLKISSPDALEKAAGKLLEAFPGNRVFAFYGEMGSGKTTLIKTLCRILEVTDRTSSPSFGLIHEYRTNRGASVYHFDFYRIKDVEEVYDIGYEEYMYGGEYCFVEWPELVEKILPEDTIRLSLRITGKKERELRELG